MDQLIEQFSPILSSYVPHLLGAMGILVVGWIVAHLLASATRGVIHRTTADMRLANAFFPDEPSREKEIRNGAGRLVFFLIMLFVLIGVFQTLQLTQVNEPLNRLLQEVFQFLPRLLSGALLLGLAWFIATVLRSGVTRLLSATRMEEKLRSQADLGQEQGTPLISSIGDTVYWLVFLFFLPAILGALALEGLLDPVRDMTQTLLGYLPKLFAAALILILGWFLAKVVRRIVTSLLQAAGADRLAERIGLTQVLGAQALSQIIGLIVYVLILLPVLIASLNALELNAITLPASNMLQTILGTLPDFFAAALILGIAYVVGKVVAPLISNVLQSLGFNDMFARMGLSKATQDSSVRPSALVGTLLMIVIMLFAAMEATEVLGLGLLANLIADFTVFGAQILLGLLVFGLGLYLANLAHRTIVGSRIAQASILANGARVAILVLTTAMALREMGLADEIVNLAFGLTLGALAVALAIALGLGGREIAATELKDWVKSIKNDREGKGGRSEGSPTKSDS